MEEAARSGLLRQYLGQAIRLSNWRDPADPAFGREYCDRRKAVVDRIRGANKKLERAFDDAYAGRP